MKLYLEVVPSTVITLIGTTLCSLLCVMLRLKSHSNGTTNMHAVEKGWNET